MSLSHLAIPCDAVLCCLPSELRGPAWHADVFPNVKFLLPRSSVLSQLRKGRVFFPLAQFIADIPHGWLKPDAKMDTLVEVNLARLIKAIPRELLLSAAKDDAVPEDLSQIRDFFAPGQQKP